MDCGAYFFIKGNRKKIFQNSYKYGNSKYGQSLNIAIVNNTKNCKIIVENTIGITTVF